MPNNGKSWWEVNHIFVTDITNVATKKNFFSRVTPRIYPPTFYMLQEEEWNSNLVQAGQRTGVRQLLIPIDRTGTILPQFVDDYYNRLHIEPRNIYTGVVSGDVYYTIAIFNAKVFTT